MSSKTTSTSTSQRTLSPELQSAYSGILSQANNLNGQTYSGELTAPMTATQRQAMTSLSNLSGEAANNPYYTQASDLLNRSSTPISLADFSADAVNKYMSPYTDSVINSTLAAMNEQYGQQANSLRGSAAAAGALGSDRAGVAQAALAGQQSLATNQTLANLYNTAYQNALSQYNQEQNRNLSVQETNSQNALNAAGTYANLGSASIANQLAAYQALFNTGTVEQQTAQNADTAKYQAWLQQYSNLADIANVLGNVTNATAPVSTTEKSKKQLPGDILGMIMKDGGRAQGFDDGGTTHAAYVPSYYRPPIDQGSSLAALSASHAQPDQGGASSAASGLHELAGVNQDLKSLGEKDGISGLFGGMGDLFGGSAPVASTAGSAAAQTAGAGAAESGALAGASKGLAALGPWGWLAGAALTAYDMSQQKKGGRTPLNLASGGDTDDNSDDDAPVQVTPVTLADANTDRQAMPAEIPASWNKTSTVSAPKSLAEAKPQEESFWQSIGAAPTPGTGEGANYHPGSPGWGRPLLTGLATFLTHGNLGEGLSAGLGEYTRENELDAHPVVDNSGLTQRVYYPSEKRWIDTGLPTRLGVEQQQYQQGRADKATTLLNPQQAAALGFRPGTVVSKNALGQYNVEQASDVASEAAQAQKLNLIKAGQGPEWANLAEKKREFNVGMGLDENGKPVDATASPDPNSGSILSQAGLSYPAFLVLTGQASKLPRDAASRKRAFNEAQEFANKKGVDVSTFGSQYNAYNDVLQKNITRVNQTRIMENELNGTIDNLKPVADAAGNGSLRIGNVAKLFAGQEVNDPTVQQYAFQLQQLRSELAAYNGALQGRTGNNLTMQDYAEAERVIKNGLSSKGADGLRKAVASATEKMGSVLDNSVRAANKSVWGLFGVGDKYDKAFPQNGANNQSAPQKQQFEEGRIYTDAKGRKAKYQGGQWVPVP